MKESEPKKPYEPPKVESLGETASRIVGKLISKTEELKTRAERAEQKSSEDPLTGLLNRRGFKNRATPEVSIVARQSGLAEEKGYIESVPPLTFVVVDIDKFKHINDSYGHEVGDRALKAVAEFLNERFARGGDITARSGEGADEFWVLATSDMEHTQERLRLEGRSGFGKITIPSDIVVDGKQLEITLSVGVAAYRREGKETAEAAIDRTLKQADALAYQAKGNNSR